MKSRTYELRTFFILLLLTILHAMFCNADNYHLPKLLFELPKYICEYLEAEACGRYEPPEIAQPIQNVSARKGEDAVFDCHIKNLGGNKISWLKQNPAKLIAFENGKLFGKKYRKYSVRRSQDSWQLKIKDVHPKDAGGYVCQINSFPMIQKVGYLTLLVAPKIREDLTTGANIEVREGENVTLYCIADGFPKPSYKWRRSACNGEPCLHALQETPYHRKTTISHQNLLLTKVGRNASGEYQCIAHNGIDPNEVWKIRLSVEFPPLVYPYGSPVIRRPRGNDVTLTCLLEVYPACIVSWWKLEDHDRVRITQSSKHKPMEQPRLRNDSMYDYQLYSNLRIKHIEEEDYLPYICHCSNKYGKHETIIDLKEQVPYKDTDDNAVFYSSGDGPIVEEMDTLTDDSDVLYIKHRHHPATPTPPLTNFQIPASGSKSTKRSPENQRMAPFRRNVNSNSENRNFCSTNKLSFTGKLLPHAIAQIMLLFIILNL